MRRVAIGLAVGVAVWVGSAVAAEAQTIQITPIGPTALKTSDTQTIYSASVTASAPGPAQYEIYYSVYVNNEILPRYTNVLTTETYTYLGTFNYRKRINLTGSNLQSGDVVKFKINYKWCTDIIWQEVDSQVTVSGS
jgi:hypothetical protein